MKSFAELSPPEILALAISSEEEDGRIYSDFAEGPRPEHPDTARVFSDMAAEENEHRRAPIDLYVSRFGGHIPLIRRQDIQGFVSRKKLWQVRLSGIDAVRQRDTPYLRGTVCGLMTIARGIGHTLPYLIPNFYTATVLAVVVVLLELLSIACIQWRYMDTPPFSAAAKVMLGGGLVVATGVLIGSS